MNITIRVIPEGEQRPEVNGADWRFEQEYACRECGYAFVEHGEQMNSHACSGCGKLMQHIEWLRVFVSPMSDWRREVLLQIHETVEAIMCRHNGVTQAAVDKFDLEYDRTHTFDLNAGDDPAAPYGHEHCVATAIERILCAELGVNWKNYDDELAQSYPGPSKCNETT